MAPKPRDPRVRFWEKVQVGDPDECWPWLAYLSPDGYGGFRSGRRGSRNVRAHRFAWAITNGPIPDGMFVCHRCDNPVCVNPAHLFLGTPSDNMRDMLAKRRNVTTPGERNTQAKLTGAQIVEIRALANRLSQGEIARCYGVGQPAISRILRGERWAHVS